MDELIEGPSAKSPSFSPNDGWRIMPRVPHKLRRPGARHSFDCDDYYEYFDPNSSVAVEGSRLDRYLASKSPGSSYGMRRNRMMKLDRFAQSQQMMLGKAEWLCMHAWRRNQRPFEFCMDIRDAVVYLCSDWDEYAQDRMHVIAAWFQCGFKQMPTPEQQRQFEKEAWYWDREHKDVLAARRRVARAVILRLLRMAVKRRAVALYWQEQTQRALCAPGGAGRAADAVAFESEFA